MFSYKCHLHVPQHRSIPYSPNLLLLTARQNGSTSLAHLAVPFPCMRSQHKGKPPIPSNRLPIVALCGKYPLMRSNIHVQNGSAMLFPKALYLALSLAFTFFPFISVSGISVYPSGYPCSLSHSNGVSRRTAPVKTAAWSPPAFSLDGKDGYTPLAE